MRPTNISLDDILRLLEDSDADALPMQIVMDESEYSCSYISREQAIEDGALVSVNLTAKELGVVYPFAITAAAWTEAVSPPFDADWDSEDMRLNRLIERTMFELNQSANQDVWFSLHVINGRGTVKEVKLRAGFGPDDDLQPAITVMLGHEEWE